MDQIRAFVDQLIERSKPKMPIWNVEVLRSGKPAKWNYIDGCMIKAILGLYEITKEDKYLTFANDFVSPYIREDGSIEGFDLEEQNIDNINAGKTLFDLYALTGDEKYRKSIDFIYSELKKMPRIETGNFWHKKIYPHQVWLDGLYMAQPFYMTYETRFNKLENYKDIFSQFSFVHRTLKDDKTGLLYHGYDHSKQMYWSDPQTGLSPSFWVRSMGWYVMALVDTIEAMDRQMFYEFRMLNQWLKEAIDALITFQDAQGMWYQVIDAGGKAGNYLETSGSAMIAYAILKATRMELLPERYRQIGLKAYNGIKDKYLMLEGETLNLGGICLVAGLGGKDRRDGSYAYYISEPIVENDAKGVAPFLLCYTEILRL